MSTDESSPATSRMRLLRANMAGSSVSIRSRVDRPPPSPPRITRWSMVWYLDESTTHSTRPSTTMGMVVDSSSTRSPRWLLMSWRTL
ncbi:Uncharacterised protein [Flavonifractor plautii]|uniref:Uncharacterized protein n=1 Tax=Flavonifractor plautii TaxID=292800 RepID=A0A174ANH4_FLAPL|nr:Uncharacterised protein [Flavonifractor plautii]